MIIETDFFKYDRVATIPHEMTEIRWYSLYINRAYYGIWFQAHIDGLVQDYNNSIAYTLELLQSCIKSSIWTGYLATDDLLLRLNILVSIVFPYCHRGKQIIVSVLVTKQYIMV